MQRVQLSPDVSLSRLVYGTWRLAEDADTSPAHIRAKIHACLDQGITTIDHADIYGGYAVEELFGAAIKGTDLAKRIEIVTKCGIMVSAGRYTGASVKHYDTSAAHIHRSVDMSLKLISIEHIDLLLIHRPNPLMDFQETGQALDAVVKSGKVRAVGVSNFRPWDTSALQAAMTTKLATNQIELSLQATDAFTNGDLADLQQRGLPPMAWSPLGGGTLISDKSALGQLLDEIARANKTDRAGVALAWLLAHPSKILPVLGTNNLARIAAASEAFSVKMDRETWFRLYEAATGREVP
jgi:predicted oxidoreductase